MNGLLTVKRKENGYRVYLEAILRLLQQLSQNPNTDIHVALNTPKQTDDIISVCDRLIVSLLSAEGNANTLLQMLHEMKIQFS